MQAEPHPQQEERLAALRAYGILDTEREADFDDIVQLASELCGTPISVVNLIDEHRQWFKAEVGLGVRETPIESSICAHAILGADLVEIRDTLVDPRMAGNPLVTGTPGLRFYAGVLLVGQGGLPLGTLCVLDYQPRELTDLQRNALRVLARQVMMQIELRRALRTAEMLRKEVDHRVKNSLQLLASLTSLQSRTAPDAETRAALDLVRHRIASIAELHDLLHKTDAGSAIDLDGYLPQVLATLRPSLPAHVTLTEGIAPVQVNSRTATSLALLINELVINSVKHAFPDAARPGDIQVALQEAPDGSVTLDYRDTGGGIDPSAPQNGLGMRVIDTLVAQMAGSLAPSTGAHGFSLRLTLPPQINGAAPAP
jgi:two-component sensor histidine kinase